MQLYLLAHQDDEIFVLSRIFTALKKKEDLAVVFITDGGEFSARRDAESRAVLESVGVAPGRIIFLGSSEGLPDGRLHLHLPRALKLLEQTAERLPEPSAVITHAWEGGHHDHDCVHALAVVLAHRRGWSAPVLQMPFYRELRRLRNYFAPMWPLRENGEICWRQWSWRSSLRTLLLMRLYRTQWRTFRYHGPAMLLRRLIRARDAHQIASLERLSERPHKGPLYYERRFNVHYEAIEAALAPLLAELKSNRSATDEAELGRPGVSIIDRRAHA